MPLTKTLTDVQVVSVGGGEQQLHQPSANKPAQSGSSASGGGSPNLGSGGAGGGGQLKTAYRHSMVDGVDVIEELTFKVRKTFLPSPLYLIDDD